MPPAQQSWRTVETRSGVDSAGRLVGTVVRHPSAETLVVAAASRLKVPPIGSGHFGTQYDVSPDGQRVYFLDGGDKRPPREFGFILGWRALFK